MIFENPLHRRHVLSEHREDPPLSDNARTVVGPIYGYGLVVHDLDGRTRRVSAELLVRKRQDAAPVSYVASAQSGSKHSDSISIQPRHPSILDRFDH